MNRRFLLSSCSVFLAFFLAVFAFSGCATLQTQQSQGLAIVQGLTNATATQIAIVAPPELALEFFYGTDTAITKTRAITISPREKRTTDAVVYQLQIDGLKIGSDYTLEIREADGTGVHRQNPYAGRLVDRRTFRALDVKPRPARVIAASCLYDFFLKESVGMWKAVIDAKPDLLLLIGDNVYAEVANGRFPSPLDEAALWTRYTETFQALDYYKTPQLIPTLVTWDDHDYGMKDGDRDNPHKLASKKVLEAFFPQTPSPAFPEFQTGPGVSSRFDAFGYRFLLLDNRSFRTAKNTPVEFETHFGDEQDAWIFRNVRGSKTPVWLISGDQWFGAYHRFESFEGRQPKNFKNFLSKLHGSATVMFMSGDRHMSEINRIEPGLLGYETFEFTSSSLHSKMHRSNWDTIPNPRQVHGVDLQHAFTLFDLTPELPDRSLRLLGETRGQESKVHYSFDFQIKRARLEKPRR